MNTSTIIVFIALAAALFGAVVVTVANRRKGKTCHGDCTHCAGCGRSHTD